MKILDAKKVAIQIFKEDPTLNLCFVGGSGLGKTTIAREIAEELNKPLAYIPIRSDDAMGLNLPNKQRTIIEFSPHKRLQTAINQPCLIYIDEFNRADRLARAQIMELLGERTVGGISIHPESNILLTLNDESDQYDTIETDKAFKTRCIPIPVTLDIDCSVQWAEQKGFHEMALYLQQFGPTLAEDVTWNLEKVDTRFLSYLNRVQKTNISNNLNNEIMNFCLGNKATPFLRNTISEKIAKTLIKKVHLTDYAEHVLNIVNNSGNK